MSRGAHRLRPAVPAREETAALEEDDWDNTYYHGWRERREIAPDGSERLAWSPLTYHDLVCRPRPDVTYAL